MRKERKKGRKERRRKGKKERKRKKERNTETINDGVSGI